MNSKSNTFAHRLEGPCKCGHQHGTARDDTYYRQEKNNGGAKRESRTVDKRYDYLDEEEKLLIQVCRTNPKGFFQQRPDGNDGWLRSLREGQYYQTVDYKTGEKIWYHVQDALDKGHAIPSNAPREHFPAARRVLYHLPELLKSNPNEIVFIVEGEKDVERLEMIDCIATTNPEGAGKFHFVAEQARKLMAGRPVIVLPDNDDPGRDHAEQVARSLHGAAASLKVINLPGLDKKGDIADWIEKRLVNDGMSTPDIKAALLDIVNAAPEWTPPATDTAPSGAAETAQAETKPICMADIQPVPVSWLWEGRIARGKITLIAGNPGLGKSFLSLDLAARVSTGTKFPDGTPGCPGKALLLSAEDDLADTIRPRLDAAGGDCTNILARRYGDLGNLESQLPQLEADLKDTKPALLIVDPITAFLGRLDAHRNDEIRSLFARLTELAARYNVAVVVVSHLNKSTSQSAALHRVTGSLGFVAAARAAYLVERDPENLDDRLFLPLKNNLGDDLTGFRFRLDGEPGSIPRLEWDSDPVTITADEILAQKSGKEPTAQGDAERWLRDVLADGPMESDRIKRMALRDGYSWRTIRRAQKNLGIKPKKSGFENGWTWTLPEDGQLDDIWPPSGNHNEDGQTTPKMAKLNEHETWPPSMNLATFDESNPDACEDGQTDKTWPPSMDEPPSENPSPTVEEEF